jgi:hypothetical protein
MANLEHPNTVRVDDFGETAGRFWLRMELATEVQVSGVFLECARKGILEIAPDGATTNALEAMRVPFVVCP